MPWVVLILWALGFVLLARVPRCVGSAGASPSRRIPDEPAGRARLPPSRRSDEKVPVSVIIPARNEERNIGRLLDAINRQTSSPREVIVVDDGSTDRTAEIARAAGASVISPPEPPAGWRGKTWACRTGADAAVGDILLFLDADTTLKEDGLARLLATREACAARAFSAGPYHDVRRPYEQLSAVFNLLMFIGVGAFSLFDSPRRPRGLFGPCLLIDRQAYEEIGGHACVKGDILEHMALAGKLRERGIPMACVGGRGAVHMRMYPDGLRDLVEGWTKAFADGASRTPPLLLILTVAWMTGGMLAFIFLGLMPLLAGVCWPLPVYAIYAAQFHFLLRQVGRFSPLAALLYPLLLLFFFVVFARSAVRRKRGGHVTWKGRRIRAREEESP